MASKEHLVNAFRNFDLNKDGVIQRDEFIEVLTRPTAGGAQLSYDEALMLFTQVDLNKDNEVSLEEFAISWGKERVETLQKKEDDILQVINQAQSVGMEVGQGAVDKVEALRDAKNEINQVVYQTLQEQIFPEFHHMMNVFNALDTNPPNGKISYMDFAAVLKKKFTALTDEELKILASKYDTDGDGSIDYMEFKEAFLPRPGAIVFGASFYPAAPAGVSAPYSAPPIAQLPPSQRQPPAAMAGSAGAPLREPLREPSRPPLDAMTLARVSAIEDTLKTKLDEKFSNVRATFRHVDSDGSGFIDAKEFRNILERTHVNIPPEYMDLLIARFDTDGNGKVDFNEFSKWMAPSYFTR